MGRNDTWHGCDHRWRRKHTEHDGYLESPGNRYRIKKAYDKGIVLAGGSAGSLCWFTGGSTDSRPKELSIVECLGFLAILSIIEKKPLKPDEKRQEAPEQKKRRIDVNNLKWVMSAIHIPTFDHFLEEIPQKIIGRIFFLRIALPQF